MALELVPPGYLDEMDRASNETAALDEAATHVPPNDMDAEGATLSVVLACSRADDSPRAIETVCGLGLEPEYFYSEAHRRIFEACVALNADGQPVDAVQVATWLRDRGRLAQVGGLEEIGRIQNTAPTAGHVAAYAGTVIAKWRARQAIASAQKTCALGYAGTPADVLVSSALADLESLRSAETARVEILDGPLLAEPLAPIEWLCPALKLAPGAPTNAAGNAFSGKSLAWADVALAVATGGDAWGSHRCRRGSALILDYDGQGRRVSQERLQRLARSRGVDLRELGQSIGYIRSPGFYIDDANAADRLCRLLDGRALCIIDSWRGATPNTDEWRRGPVQEVGSRLEKISTRAGCTIVVIDHNVKPPRDQATGVRSAMHDVHGSTAKAEMAQSHFAFEGVEGETLTQVRHVKERVTGRPVAPFALRFEDVATDDGNPVGGLRVVHVDRDEGKSPRSTAGASKFSALKAAILETVRQHSDLTSANAIAPRVTGSRAAVLEAIRELRSEGRLSQPGGEGSAFRVVG